MPVPQFLLDLLQLLFDLAFPRRSALWPPRASAFGRRVESISTSTAARANGFCGRSFFSQSHSFSHGLQPRAFMFLQQAVVGTSWLASMETVFKNFVNQIVVARLVPVIAAYFVLKAALDVAGGENPLSSILAAFF